MYEWALLAQISLIRLVYHPSDNVSYVCSGLQVRVLLMYKYKYTYIHSYMCTYNAASLYLMYHSGSLSLRKALPMRTAALYMYWPFWVLCI
jgi:hypothetical protein